MERIFDIECSIPQALSLISTPHNYPNISTFSKSPTVQLSASENPA